jgi:hypothetical protein
MAEDELELTNEQVERNDEIDNAVFNCFNILAEKELKWDMEVIGGGTTVIKSFLKDYGIEVRHPGIVTLEDGTQEYREYD